MPAHQTENRTHIEAGGAADTLQGLLEHGIMGHGAALVIHEHDVQILYPAVIRWCRPSDHAHIAGEQLGRGTARQSLQNWRNIGKLGHQFFQANHGHMHLGQSGGQAGIALVGNQHNSAGFSHSNIATRNTHASLQKFGPQFFPRQLHQARDIRAQALFHLFAENIGHIFAGKMDGWHNHVRRPLPSQLDNPFAQVGFCHLNALFF